VVVSIFLISIYCVKVFDKLSLDYYFLNELQEKDFFDKKITLNKKLNIVFCCFSFRFYILYPLLIGYG
jgi:hypothetical protein